MFLVIPILVVILSALLADARGPYSLGRNLDPDYCYLLNSLSILLFHQPGLVEHPGTAAQEVGAVAVFVKWLGTSLSGTPTPLAETVLAHPEAFLHAINFLFSLLVAGAIFLAGLRMYRASGSLLAACILQLTFFLYRETVMALPRVDPEPVLLLAGFAMMFPLIPLLFSQEPANSPGAASAGAILGFGLVTKVTFLPWITTVALFRGRSQRVRFVLAALLSSFVFLLPILSSLTGVMRWLTAVLTHKGPYGSGDTGVPPLAQLTTNFKSLYGAEPYLFYGLVFYLAVLIALRFGRAGSQSPLAQSVHRLLAVGCVAIVFQLVMAIKHFVAPRYLVPALVLTSLLHAFLVVLFEAPILRTAWRVPLALCGGALFITGLWSNVPRLKQLAIEGRQYQEEITRLADLRRQFVDCTVIGYYSSSAGYYALAFGSEYTRGVHGKLLNALYPNIIEFHGDFMSFSQENRQSEVRRLLNEGHCVLMQGWPHPERSGFLPSDLIVEPLVSEGGESIGRLIPKGSHSPCVNSPVCFNLPANAVALKAEKFSSGTVVADTSVYGVGIGVIVSPRYPAYVEYKLPLVSAGRYELWIRYAAEETRPLILSIDGKIMTKIACAGVTGGWYPDDQRAWKIGTFDFVNGIHTLRLESTGAFPAIDKLGLVKLPEP